MSTPKTVQSKLSFAKDVGTVVRLRRKSGEVVQDCDVYIGRECKLGGWDLPESVWHNPYSLRDHSREEALKLYEAHVRNDPELMKQLPSLAGKRLGCWCHPLACHGDVLLKLLKEHVYKGK